MMQKRTLLVVLTLLTAPLVLLVNGWALKSQMLGVVASLAFFIINSMVIGELLFSREDRVFRVTLGFVSILMFLAIVGNILSVLAHFTEMTSFVALMVLNAVLSLAFVRFKRSQLPRAQNEPIVTQRKNVIRKSVLFLIPFLLSTAVAFGLLVLGRTGEGGESVWLTIPEFFIPLFILVSFSLVSILVFTDLSRALKLGLVCVYSFLAHSLFLLVWYPGRFGDPWVHLGAARYIAKTGMPYAYSWMVSQLLIVDLALKVQEALTVFLGRMFSIDLYWVHVALVPLLWAVLVPLIAYKIAEMLSVSKSKIFPILTAIATILFPSLILWGAVSVANSLGFLFFFVSVMFILLWMNQGGKSLFFMSLLASSVAFLAHPQTGIFAFMMFVWSIVLKLTSRKILWVASYVSLFLVYPLALLSAKASFSLHGLFVLDNFLSFQSEISTILLVFGIVGLVFAARSRLVDTKSAMILFVFYVTILSEYYLTNFGMTGLPYGAGRVMAMVDFLLVPFVALGFLMIARAFGKESSVKSQLGSSVGSSLKRYKLDPSRRFVGWVLVCLVLSVQTTVALYQAYPRKEIVAVQPSAYEVEAIQFIDSNSRERYVVLGHPTFASLAIGFLGLDYGWAGGDRGLFGMPQSQAYQGGWYPTVQMYYDMTKNPSIGIMEQAMEFANAKLSYFVVSMRDPKFDDIVKRTTEVLPVYRIFGNDRLYVFAYPLPLTEEPGSLVRVAYDDGLGGEENVRTTFSYMVESEIDSTLTLTGHTSYNVTEFPMHWNFLELSVDGVLSRFDDSSDIDTFVYVKGLETSNSITIKWHFNRRYPTVGWKEGSFRRLEKWGTHELYKGTMVPTITSDGNVLRMSYSFSPGSYWYYYYTAKVNLATDDYPYLLLRWRSNQRVAVAYVYFEYGASLEVVPFGSTSPEWSSIVKPLPSGAIVRSVMVGLSNVMDQRFSGIGALEVDYILFASSATP